MVAVALIISSTRSEELKVPGSQVSQGLVPFEALNVPSTQFSHVSPPACVAWPAGHSVCAKTRSGHTKCTSTTAAVRGRDGQQQADHWTSYMLLCFRSHRSKPRNQTDQKQRRLSPHAMRPREIWRELHSACSFKVRNEPKLIHFEFLGPTEAI